MIIHLFLCRVLPQDDRHVPVLLDRLDADERNRAARFVFDRDRRTYVAAHALLRHALDRLAGPRPWRFIANDLDKPRLDPPCDDIRFSLTHTEGLVAVALAHGREVGVDAEPAERDPDEFALRALALAPEEIADLDGFADRRRRLLQLWVGKEALAKTVGLGLSLPLPEVVLRGDPPRVMAMPAGHGAAPEWWLHVEPYGAHWLALAMLGAPHRVERTVTTVAGLAGAL